MRLRRGVRAAATLAAAVALHVAAAAASAGQDEPGAAPGTYADAAPRGGGIDQASALADSQRAIGNVLGDYTLRDVDGRPVRLTDLRGKPLLISFIYTGCFQACPTGTRALKRAVESALGALSPDSFNVVSVGFNQPFDTPAAMRAYAGQSGVDLPNWRFLSPDPATLAALARDLGFRYAPTAGGFDHVAQVTLVDADGVIAAQVYGERFAPPELVEPLRKLLAGARPDQAPLAGLLQRVRLLCTYYDPASGRYRVKYAIFLELAGGITGLLALGILGARALRPRPRLG